MKLQEIKDKTIEELKDAILSAKKELFQLRIKDNKMSPLENPAQIKNLKKIRASTLRLTFKKHSYLITSIVNAQGNMSYVVEFPCAWHLDLYDMMKTMKNVKKRKFKRTIPDNLKI